MIAMQVSIAQLEKDAQHQTNRQEKTWTLQRISRKKNHYDIGFHDGSGQGGIQDCEQAYKADHGTEFYQDWLDGWLDASQGREHGYLWK